MIQMTSQQYQQKYGTTPTIPQQSGASNVSQPIKMTRAQYQQKYGQPVTPKSLGGFAKNVVKSGGKLIGDTVGAVANVFNPDMEQNTVANLGKLAVGTAQYFDPTQALGTQFEDKARAVGNFYKDRYGGIDKIGETLYNDPVGVLADVAGVATGAGGIVKGGATLAGKAGMASKASRLANVGNKLTSFGSRVDPIVGASKSIGKVFSKVKIPSNGIEATDILRLKTIADREGVKMPVSATTSNPFVRQGEVLTAKGVFGKNVAERFDDYTSMPSKMLEKLTNENVSDVSTLRNSLGQSVRDELKTFSKGFKQKASKFYDEIESELGNVPVTTAKTTEMIKKLAGQQKLSAVPQAQSRKFLEALGKNIRKRSTYAKLNQTRKDIGQLMNSTDPVASGQQAQLKAIYSAIEQDLNSIAKNTDMPRKATAYTAKQSMDAEWKDFTKLLNKQEGRQVLGDTIDIEDIVPKIYRPNNASSIKRLKQFIKPETATELGNTLITEIVNGTVGRDRLIDPQKWLTAMRKWDKPTLVEAIGEVGMRKLEEISKVIDDVQYVKKQIEPINKIYSGSQTAMLANTSVGAGALAGSIMALNPIPILSYLLSNAGGAMLFGTEKGRNLLTKGSLPKLPASVLKYGSKAYNTGKVGRMNVQSEQDQAKVEPMMPMEQPKQEKPVFRKNTIKYPTLQLKGYR